MEGNAPNPADGVANNNGQPQRRVLASYTIPNPRNCGSSILTPNVHANNFELKPQLITLVQNNCQYRGSAAEDPNQHLSVFLRICETVKTNGVNPDIYKLLLFLFSLRDKATHWKALDYSSGGSLQMMKTAQEAYDLIDMVANNEYFYSSERQAAPKKGVFELEGVDTILAQNKLMQQQLQQQIESMTKRMDGLQLAAVSTTNQPPVVWGQQEENYEEQQPKQVQYMHNQGSGSNDFHGDTYNSSWRNHPNLKWGENQNQQPWSGRTLVNDKETTKRPVENAETSSKEEVTLKAKQNQEKLKEKEEQPQASKKGKEVIEEQSQEQRKMVKTHTPPLPYPQRFQKEIKDQQFPKFLEVFKKLEINIPLAEALEQMPLYAKFLKELINKKRSYNEKETVILTQECSTVIQEGSNQNSKTLRASSCLVPWIT
ncbi:uncharacterized protein [Arachis hypogaea]|uniref:uncharacterized protein n=1 Tax=Arachis hypogaea TaxID=3818 RepID=UPI000DEC969C|nr:uncharacterized protein LOC112721587 [Arachis hypogaea]